MLLREKGVDITKLFERTDSILNNLIGDPWKLVELIEIVVSDQLSERKIERIDFLEALSGDVLDEATIAFLNGVAMALPKLQRRAIQAILRKISTGLESGATKIEAKIASLDLEKEIDAVIGS